MTVLVEGLAPSNIVNFACFTSSEIPEAFITIDWGDGNIDIDTKITNKKESLVSHEYTSNGSFLIKITGELEKIDTVSCLESSLTTLNVSGLVNLTDLDCNTNSLTTFDITGLNNLVFINCQYNKLTTEIISNILILLDSFGNTNGSIYANEQTPRAVLTPDGFVAYDNLSGKGWILQIDTSKA